jgi:hypothetical protein
LVSDVRSLIASKQDAVDDQVALRDNASRADIRDRACSNSTGLSGTTVALSHTFRWVNPVGRPKKATTSEPNAPILPCKVKAFSPSMLTLDRTDISKDLHHFTFKDVRRERGANALASKAVHGRIPQADNSSDLRHGMLAMADIW